MPNSLQPGYIVQNYHRSQFVHKQLLPTREPTRVGIPPTDASYEAWGGGSVLASAMMNDLSDFMTALLTTDAGLDDWLAFEQIDPGLPAFICAGVTGSTGAVVISSTAQTSATQSTYTFRDNLGFKFRFVVMEQQLEVFTPKRGIAALTASEQDLVNYLLGDTHAFASRAGGKPVSFMSATYTLNEKLRRSERLA